jgi:hypothetical protein
MLAYDYPLLGVFWTLLLASLFISFAGPGGSGRVWYPVRPRRGFRRCLPAPLRLLEAPAVGLR